jgi:hypothetical protein
MAPSAIRSVNTISQPAISTSSMTGDCALL